MNNFIPTCTEKYDKDIEEGLELLLSFVMAKNMHIEYRKILKDYQEQKNNVKREKNT